MVFSELRRTASLSLSGWTSAPSGADGTSGENVVRRKERMRLEMGQSKVDRIVVPLLRRFSELTLYKGIGLVLSFIVITRTMHTLPKQVLYNSGSI